MREAVFKNKWTLVDTLANIKAGNSRPSYYHIRGLVDDGYLKAVTIKKEGRGRPGYNYVLTGKANGLLGLAKNWKRPVKTGVVDPNKMFMSHADHTPHPDDQGFIADMQNLSYNTTLNSDDISEIPQEIAA